MFFSNAVFKGGSKALKTIEEDYETKNVSELLS